MTALRKLAFAALVFAEILAQYWSIPALKAALGPIAFAAWALALLPAGLRVRINQSCSTPR